MDVSIIVPVYNNAPFIKECINSLINQKTNYSYEIIAIDDGSTDNSLDILKEFKKNITLITKENTGPGDTRNVGIKKAKGKYLMFVDSDDYVDENFVEIMTKNIIKYNTDIVICDFYRVKGKNKELETKGKFKLYEKNNIHEVLLMEFHSCNKIFKKENFLNNLYPENMFYEDVVAISLNELSAKSILKIEEPLYYYRYLDKGTTNVINETNYDLIKSLKLIEKEFIKNNYQDEIEFLYINNVLVDLIIKLIKANKPFSEIKKIKKEVELKYPNWYKNKYLKNTKIFKQLYLLCLKLNLYSLIKLVFRR